MGKLATLSSFHQLEQNSECQLKQGNTSEPVERKYFSVVTILCIFKLKKKEMRVDCQILNDRRLLGMFTEVSLEPAVRLVVISS